MSAIGIDKCENRPPKLLGKVHDAQGFTIPLGMRHAKVAISSLLGVARLLLTNDNDFVAVETCHATNDGGIIGKSLRGDELDRAVAKALGSL